MPKILLAVDAENLFRAYAPRARLDYSALLRFLKEQGELVGAHLYTIRTPSGAEEPFLHAVRRIGFDRIVARFPHRSGNENVKSDVDVAMAIGVVLTLLKLEKPGKTPDVVVLATGDSDFLPLVEWLDAQGYQVWVIGPPQTAWELQVFSGRFWQADDVPGLVTPPGATDSNPEPPAVAAA
jgi:uncharacterized LabA/DUF88 family protein